MVWIEPMPEKKGRCGETGLNDFNQEKGDKCVPRISFHVTFIVLEKLTYMYLISILFALGTHLYEARGVYGNY